MDPPEDGPGRVAPSVDVTSDNQSVCEAAGGTCEEI